MSVLEVAGRPAERGPDEQGGVDQQQAADPDAQHVAPGHRRGRAPAQRPRTLQRSPSAGPNAGAPSPCAAYPTTSCGRPEQTSAGQPMREPSVVADGVRGRSRVTIHSR